MIAPWLHPYLSHWIRLICGIRSLSNLVIARDLTVFSLQTFELCLSELYLFFCLLAWCQSSCPLFPPSTPLWRFFSSCLIDCTAGSRCLTVVCRNSLYFWDQSRQGLMLSFCWSHGEPMSIWGTSWIWCSSHDNVIPQMVFAFVLDGTSGSWTTLPFLYSNRTLVMYENLRFDKYGGSCSKLQTPRLLFELKKETGLLWEPFFSQLFTTC